MGVILEFVNFSDISLYLDFFWFWNVIYCNVKNFKIVVVMVLNIFMVVCMFWVVLCCDDWWVDVLFYFDEFSVMRWI